MLENIFISGITPIDAYPESKGNKYYKQCIQKVDLCIPNVKPDIEDINEIQINPCIERIKVINTVLGPKLVIEGRQQIKIIYTADNRVQSVHSAHWEVGFHEYVLLEGMHEQNCTNRIRCVFIGIEDVGVTCMDRRRVSLSIIFVLCPQIRRGMDEIGSNDINIPGECYVQCMPINKMDDCCTVEKCWKKGLCYSYNEPLQTSENERCKRCGDLSSEDKRYCRRYGRKYND